MNESPTAGLVLARSVFLRYCHVRNYGLSSQQNVSAWFSHRWFKSLNNENIIFRTYTGLDSDEFQEDLRTLVVRCDVLLRSKRVKVS
jgi:hypothetical protein